MSGPAHTLRVGRVDAFRVPGLGLWFNSNDHLPPHFPAEMAGAWEVIVRFLRPPSEMIKIVWSTRRVSRKKLQRLTRAAARHRAALLREWEKKVLRKTPGDEE